jgi:hypothetical protein
MSKHLLVVVALGLAAGVALAIVFLSTGLPFDWIEVAVCSLWAIGSIAGWSLGRGKAIRSMLWCAVGGLAGVAVYVVVAVAWMGFHWYALLLMTGLSVTGSLIVGCIADCIMSLANLTMSRMSAKKAALS